MVSMQYVEPLQQCLSHDFQCKNMASLFGLVQSVLNPPHQLRYETPCTWAEGGCKMAAVADQSCIRLYRFSELHALQGLSAIAIQWEPLNSL